MKFVAWVIWMIGLCVGLWERDMMAAVPIFLTAIFFAAMARDDS